MQYCNSAFEGLELWINKDFQNVVVLHFYLVNKVHISTCYDLCFSAFHLNKLYIQMFAFSKSGLFWCNIPMNGWIINNLSIILFINGRNPHNSYIWQCYHK